MIKNLTCSDILGIAYRMSDFMKRYRIFFILYCSALTGCTENPAQRELQRKYDLVEIGMSKSEVLAITGLPTPLPEFEKIIRGPDTTVWSSKDDSMKIVINFYDGKVTSKSHIGFQFFARPDVKVSLYILGASSFIFLFWFFLKKWKKNRT